MQLRRLFRRSLPWRFLNDKKNDRSYVVHLRLRLDCLFALALDEIEYIKSDSKYTAIVARGQTFLVRAGITEIEAQLDLTRFLGVHRSALLNLDFVDTMKTDDRSKLVIRMREGSSLTASRDSAKVLRDIAF